MEYFFNEKEKQLWQKAHDIAENMVRPIRDELDEKAEFPLELIKEMGNQGMFKIIIPEEYGGTGAKIMDMCIAVEEISRVCAGIATAYSVGALGSGPIVYYASDEQKKKYLPKIATGEQLCAFALTEAQAGSDAANIQTTARKDGDYYILNGVKQFISNASVSDVYTVLASTDKTRGARGISAFIVENNFPGISFGKEEHKLGIRASVTSELVFEDCRVPKENLMGKEGFGFIYTMRNFDRARPGVGAIALGIAQGAYEDAVDFLYKHDLLGNQYVQSKIADIATEIEAARALIYASARMIDSNAKGISKVSSFSKLYPSDIAVKVCTEAIGLMGPYGTLKEHYLEKRLRDAKITQIYEGTNEIQRVVIALEIIRETGIKHQEEQS